ncbi:hypothetical protein NQ314_006586 [Rhamnusium bicolor]|uniref:Uncharacterized protein n=1 Tax=Rhamnusium bicolor TaxID=1586634 RepID=A0AAV8Z069_9CUCU|nr:hypothetical protein NQ314_006586 [Rhamnusium bicolor]
MHRIFARQSLRLGNLIEDTQLQSFLNLLEMEWHIRISSHALATMVNKKMNAVELLPMTSDLLKLNIYISKEIGIFKVLLEKNSTETYAWFRLAECVLCRIILFNKRRGGEVSRMTLLQYCSTMDWEKESTQELMNSLTSFEKSLAKRLKAHTNKGKKRKNCSSASYR